jgi:hypothetical protein
VTVRPWPQPYPVGATGFVMPQCIHPRVSRSSKSRRSFTLIVVLHYATILLLFCVDSCSPLIGVSLIVISHCTNPLSPGSSISRWTKYRRCPILCHASFQMDGSDSTSGFPLGIFRSFVHRNTNLSIPDTLVLRRAFNVNDPYWLVIICVAEQFISIVTYRDSL